MGTERASLEKRHSILQSPSELHVKKKRNHNELLTPGLLMRQLTPHLLLPFCGKKTIDCHLTCQQICHLVIEVTDLLSC